MIIFYAVIYFSNDTAISRSNTTAAYHGAFYDDNSNYIEAR